MKKKLSISVDEQTVAKIGEKLKEGQFRSTSHLIEYAVNAYLRQR